MALADISPEAVVLLLMMYCILFLPLFVQILFLSLFCYFVLCVLLVLQTSYLGRMSWLLYLNCLSDVLLQSVVCASSSLCHGLVCNMRLWYFLI